MFQYKSVGEHISSGSDGKASARNAGDLGSIPGLGRSPGEGNGNPLQYSCLETTPWMEEPGGLESMGSQSQTRLSNFTFTLDTSRDSSGGSVVKNPPANAGDVGSILELGRSSGEGNGNPLHYSCLGSPIVRRLAGYSPWGCKRFRHNLANHSSILAWNILWTEEPGGLQFMGSQRVKPD